MDITYILHEDIAEVIHFRYSVEPQGQYVGIFGHKRYRLYTDDPNALEEIWSASAYPFSFNVTLPNDDLSSMTELLQTLVSLKTGMRCDRSEVIRYEGYAEVYPMIDSDYIYFSDEETVLLDIDTNQLVGYSLLTTHPAGRQIALEMNFADDVIAVIDGMTMCKKSHISLLTPSNLEERLLDIEGYADGMISDGTVIVNRGTELRNALITELTHVWGFEHEETTDTLIYSSSGSDLQEHMGCNFHRWIEDSIHRIMLDQKPIISFISNKMLTVADVGNVTLIDPIMQTFMTYYCLLALRKSGLSEVGLSVTPDLVAHVPVWGPEEYRKFKSNMRVSDVSRLTIHSIPEGTDPEAVERANMKYNAILIGSEIVSENLALESIVNVVYDDEVKEPSGYHTQWGKYLQEVHGVESVLESLPFATDNK